MSIAQWLIALGDKYAPVLKSSKYRETGQLTPEEFVVAGENLVQTCGTWSWDEGKPEHARDYLPPQKQYLITRRVPCTARANQQIVEKSVQVQFGNNETADWIVTHADETEEQIGDAEEGQVAESFQPQVDSDSDSDSDIPDAEDLLGDASVAVQDSATALEPSVSDITESKAAQFERHRTYDLSITYDNWYKTPRVWLFGYDEHGSPLTADQMMEDISTEHAKKTVTVEEHPHTGIRQISIHPCQHAQVMKKFIDLVESGGRRALGVDRYMFLFLKLISATIPTVNYDFTLEMDAIPME